MRVCAECRGELEAAYRFCPWCAAPQRRKLVEFFRAHPRDEGRALRVSRAGLRRSSASQRRAGTDAASIATVPSPCPRAASSRPESDDLMASPI